MMTLDLAKGSLEKTLIQLKNNLGGHIDQDFKEISLTFDSNEIFGSIKGMKMKGGISYLQFDIKSQNDICINFKNEKNNSFINFAYCSEGKMRYRMGFGETKLLNSYQTGILYNAKGKTNSVILKKDNPLSAHIISVNIEEQFTSQYKINKQIKSKFVKDTEEELIYVGSPNLKIADNIREIKAINQSGMIKSLLIEGFVHVILAREINQHGVDLEKLKQNTGSLTSNEMSKIKELSEFINNHPETPLKVSEMSRKFGLTPSKLQEGFKLMHNRTVNDYVRNVRIIKSEELIKTTDMNLSQILYTLGFSSRSYFSKIFKKKYKCSPSHYRAKIKLAATA